MTSEITRKINHDTSVSIQRIEETIRLIQDGATIPFVARYRKEATGNLDEARLRQIAERYLAHGTLVERRIEVQGAIEATDRLTPELREQIQNCENENELDDLYLPFRSKRQSKANLARRRGLEPLANYIRSQSDSFPVDDMALRFVSGEKRVPTVAAAIEGALHILAEGISEDPGYRKWLRDLMVEDGEVQSRVVKNREGRKTKYSTYYDFEEKVARIPSHRMLAIRRGAREKVLSYSIRIDDRKAAAELKSRTRIHPLRPSAGLLERAVADAYERLLKPVIENEVRTMLRERAEGEAIKVFEENLSALLLAPPAGAITVLGIDPNLKGTSKLAVVAPDGSLMEHHALRLKERTAGPNPGPTAEESAAPSESERTDTPAVVDAAPPRDLGPGTAAPDPAPEAVGTGVAGVAAAETEPKSTIGTVAPQTPESARTEGAPAQEADAGTPSRLPPEEVLAAILKRTNVRGVAIGNGAGSREAETMVRSAIQNNGLEVFVLAANEAGASVYASSPRARQEFPGLDVATRRAVSIARRLQDPLAELVKIEPKSIGVGQYQHDVDQKKLKVSLEAAVESAVNRVGVDLNSASRDLLRYVAGFSADLADAVVDYRTAHGPFPSREELRKVEGVDGRAFTQAAGFLRIRNGTEPLDETFIHPESYPIVRKVAASVGVPTADLIGNADGIRSIRFQEFESEAGPYTLGDIRRELVQPGRDSRKAFAVPRFRSDVREIADLQEGMELEGTVTNVTNFGAFVDIGVRQDGLVHISEMSHHYVSDARRAARVGDVVKVKVIGVDSDQKRISLSVKAAQPKPAAPTAPRRRSADGSETGRGTGRARRPKTREAAVSARKKPRRSVSRPEVAPTPARQLSMEEKIRMLQEKFKGPDK